MMKKFYLHNQDQARLWVATGYSPSTISKWLAGGVVRDRTRADLEVACRRLGLNPIPRDQAPIAGAAVEAAIEKIKHEVSQ